MYSTNTSHGTYVVTYDVANRIQSFRPKNILVPNQGNVLFGRFHQRLYEVMGRALSGVTIETIDMNQLRNEIWRQVEVRVTDSLKQVVLSTCPEITDHHPKSEGLLLNINRLFDTAGKIIGYGPRPGFKPLQDQLDTLVTKIAGRSVVLIEDGAFTGGTMRFVIKELERRGVRVTTIVIGFCKNGSGDTVRNALNGELVIVHPIGDLLDWIADHDLIPFMPNCGRVLGEETSQGLMPVQRADGFSCAYPYILPFGKTDEWASLPADHAQELSRLCLDISIEMFGQLGHKRTVGEFLGSNPRVSMPIEIGAHLVPTPADTEVVAFLEKARKRLD